MSDLDKVKWDRKYLDKPSLLKSRPPAIMLEEYIEKVEGTHAIDLACGNGRNTIFLASKGFQVDAVDISSVALSDLKKRIADRDIRLIEADLDNYTPKSAYYDLAVMTNYLDRELIRRTAETLQHHGTFIIETYMDHPENEKKDSNPDFLLAQEELLHLFDTTFTVLAYREFWNEPHELYKMRKQGIVVKKH
jgi:SAM-dependent methyltransferase